MNERSKTLQPMTVGDILDKTIQLYKGNFLKFVGIVLLVKGPYLLLGYALAKLVVFVLSGTSDASGEDTEQVATYGLSMVSLLLVKLLEILFVGPILIAAMTMAISERFLDRDIGIAEAYKKVMERFLPLLGTILLTGAIISAVLLAFVLVGVSMLMAGSQPGLFMIMIGVFFACALWVRYVFIPQTVILEGEGGFSAMKRSKYLVKGYFFKAFVLLILIFMALALVTEIVSFVTGKALFFLGEYSTLLAEGASNVLSVLLEPFRIAAITLLYYDFRIRKEGFDLEVMAEELEAGIDGDEEI